MSVKKALSWSFASNYLTVFVRFVSVVWVARLLTPEEIGLFSIALAGFGFLQIFRDFGIGQYIIQHKNLKPEYIRAAFAMSITICWLLATLTYVFSDIVADFYGREEVAGVFKILALNLVFIPFGTLNLSMLKRKLMFKQVAIIDVFSAVVGSMSVVVFAYYGSSYLSPAFGSLMGCITTIVVSNVFRQPETPWLPGLKGIRNVFNFGALMIVPFFRIAFVAPITRDDFDIPLRSLKGLFFKWVSITICLAIFVVTFDFVINYLGLNSVFNIFISAIFALPVWIYLVYAFKHPIYDEIKPIAKKMGVNLS